MVVAQDVMKLILEFVDKATAPMKRTANQLKALRDVSKSVKGPTAAVSKEFQNMKKWSNVLQVPMRSLNKGIADQNLAWVDGARLMDITTGKVMNVGKAMAKSKQIAKAFKFEWLGIMFAGMALTRVFKTLFRTTYETFKKAGGLITKQGQQVLALSAHWELLKYSIFNAIITALEPLIPVMIKVISFMADWVNRWPRLTAAIIIGGLVIGTLALIVGQLMLAFNALKALELASIFRSLAAALIKNPVLMIAIVVAAILLIAYFRSLAKIAKEHPKIWEKIKEAWETVKVAANKLLNSIEDVVNSFKEGEKITLTWAKTIGILTTAFLGIMTTFINLIRVIIYGTSAFMKFISASKGYLGIDVAGSAKEMEEAFELSEKGLGAFDDTIKDVGDSLKLMKDISEMADDISESQKGMAEGAEKSGDAINYATSEFINLKGALDGVDVGGMAETLNFARVGTDDWNKSIFALTDNLKTLTPEVTSLDEALGTKKSLTKTMLESIPVVGDLTEAFKAFGTMLKDKVETVILTVEAAMYGIIDATQTFIQLSTSTVTALASEAAAFDSATAAVNRYADAKRKAAGRGAR